jgi:hypothetical protein
VLFAQRDFNEAKMVLIETKREQLAAVVNAYQALGGGAGLSPIPNLNVDQISPPPAYPSVMPNSEGSSDNVESPIAKEESPDEKQNQDKNGQNNGGQMNNQNTNGQNMQNPIDNTKPSNESGAQGNNDVNKNDSGDQFEALTR